MDGPDIDPWNFHRGWNLIDPLKNSSSRAIFRPLHHFLKYFIGQSRHLPDTSIPIYPRFDRIVNTGLRFYLDHERTDHVNGLFSNYFPRKFIYSTTKHPNIHPFEQFKSNRGIRRYIYIKGRKIIQTSPRIFLDQHRSIELFPRAWKQREQEKQGLPSIGTLSFQGAKLKIKALSRSEDWSIDLCSLLVRRWKIGGGRKGNRGAHSNKWEWKSYWTQKAVIMGGGIERNSPPRFYSSASPIGESRYKGGTDRLENRCIAITSHFSFSHFFFSSLFSFSFSSCFFFFLPPIRICRIKTTRTFRVFVWIGRDIGKIKNYLSNSVEDFCRSSMAM